MICDSDHCCDYKCDKRPYFVYGSDTVRLVV